MSSATIHHLPAETASDSYQQQLGARLRHIRQQQRLTLQQVEEKSDGVWKAVVIGSYERGDRAVSVAKLAQLASFYGVPVSEMLPASGTPRPSESVGEKVVVDLARLNRDGDIEPSLEPLVRYVNAIQVQRGDYNGHVITLRNDDLRSLAIVLGLGSDDLLEVLGNRGLLVRPHHN